MRIVFCYQFINALSAVSIKYLVKMFSQNNNRQKKCFYFHSERCVGELSYQFPECQLLIWYLSHQKWPCIAVVLGSFLVGVDKWWNLPGELNQLVQGQHDTT